MQEEMELNLKDLWEVIYKRKKMIIGITAICVIIAAMFTMFFIKPKYEGKVSIVIGKENARYFYEDKYTSSDVMMYQKLVKTYVEIATSKKVVEQVNEDFSDYQYEELKSMISANPKVDTQLFTITVQALSPKDASEIANRVAEIFIEECKYILPAGELNILDKAFISSNPISPNVKLNIVISLFLGLMVSIGICFLLEYLDTKVKDEEELHNLIGIPVLASIPFDERLVVK